MLGPCKGRVKEVLFCSRLRYLVIILEAGTTKQQLETLSPNSLACLEAADANELTLATVTLANPSGESI